MTVTRQRDQFLLGQRLWGDDFSPAEIAQWYADEAEAYAELVSISTGAYKYQYHEINRRHGYSKLGNRRFEQVLGLGSAFGDELRPILDRIYRATILDPSEAFAITNLDHVPVTYVKPEISGAIAFPDQTFDLVTCFGTLHHVPNVTFVVGEISRVLKPGGLALIREPISSMGDWRKPRPGLTTHERGIPMAIMDEALAKAGLVVTSRTPCILAGLSRIVSRLIKVEYCNSPFWVAVDAAVSQVTLFNARYWRDTWRKKIAPGSMYWVAQKTGGDIPN